MGGYIVTLADGAAAEHRGADSRVGSGAGMWSRAKQVKAGEVVAEILDIDSKFLMTEQVERLEEQRGFLQSQD
jgi:hypothetical protein